MVTIQRPLSRFGSALSILVVIFSIAAPVALARETSARPSCSQIVKPRFTLRCRQTYISDNVERSGKKVTNWLVYQLKLKKQRRGKIHVYMESNYLFLDRDYTYDQRGNEWLVDLSDENHLELQEALLNIRWTESSAEVTFTHRHPVGSEIVRFTCAR